MAAFMLESLVLRGVTVLRDELAVGLRSGTGEKANMHAPGIRNSKRHPSPGCRLPDLQPVVGPVVDYSTPGVTPGAGRSRRQFGAHVLPGGTRTPGRLTTEQPTFGGTPSAIAAMRSAIPAGLAALASEARLLPLAARQSEDLRAELASARTVLQTLPVKPSWRKPAGRTPPVSTRENEGR